VTRYSQKEREQMAEFVRGKIIKRQEYDEEGDYYTITIEGETEFSFRFMTDLKKEVVEK